jgi:ADP-heptose:LPS heptosyltransferase
MGGNLPVVSELLRVLQPLGFDQGLVDARYRLEKKPLEKYAEKLTDLPEGKFICLHPFAGSPKRCAEISLWGQFAQYLKNKGESIIWVGAPNELKRLEVLGESAPKAAERSDYYVGESIQAMSALLARAKAYVGHDSGPLHIAAGLQVPVLGLFLAGLSPRTLPQGLGLAETIRLNSPKELSFHAWCEAWAALDKQLP